MKTEHALLEAYLKKVNELIQRVGRKYLVGDCKEGMGEWGINEIVKGIKVSFVRIPLPNYFP